MPPASEYASVPSTGKLKLKGVKDAKVDKQKKKKKKVKSDDVTQDFEDNSVVLKNLEDAEVAGSLPKEKRREVAVVDGKEVLPTGLAEDREEEDEEPNDRHKTEAEKRYEEQKRKRLDERLKREGVKTHKQRVEELNRYLSGLSEHHDMPRIGPG